ncbi:MAG TPA: CBS domain-containing protein, partial [Candidatus Obscuribacterales bacterium]
MPTPSLKEFIQPVPVVYQDADLDAVLEIFRQGECDRLVVVKQGQYPVGLVSLPSLMPHIIGKIKKTPIHPSASPAEKANHRQRTRSKSPILDTFIEPLANLPAHLTLSQFWPMVQNHLESATNQQWAVVDADGKFLGLLDIWLLLKYLAPTDVSQFSTIDALKPLVQLLEQLPLPLMLQTSSGQVISQNITWRQQIGDSLDPDSFIYEAAELLKPLSSLAQKVLAVEETAYQEYEYADANLSCTGMINPGGVRSLSTDRTPGAIALKTQEVSTNSETLLEVKQRKQKGRDAASGKRLGIREAQTEGAKRTLGDRIWQFVKIPLQEAQAISQLDNGEICLVLATDVTEQQQVAKEL